jgi:hypothetical protein
MFASGKHHTSEADMISRMLPTRLSRRDVLNLTNVVL